MAGLCSVPRRKNVRDTDAEVPPHLHTEIKMNTTGLKSHAGKAEERTRLVHTLCTLATNIYR